MKLGTTGTANTGFAPMAKHIRSSFMLLLICLTYLTVNSLTTCPVACVPAPPAVNAMVPDVSIVPARLPADPAAVDT